jgi:hypothetical protein
MNKKKPPVSKPKPPVKAPPATKRPQTAARPAASGSAGNWRHGLLIALLALVTWICYQPATSNLFLKTWDDPAYVTGNKLLDTLNAKNVRTIFSFHKEMQLLTKNYHPLSTLSLAINHHFSGLDPRPYHVTNILFHILNSILVYFLVFLLAGRRIWAGLLAGLLFALHPMHVESVAWVSERKDVMYAFFFIAGLIAYYFYVKKERALYLFLTLALFYLSVLSKAMAVVFPLALLLMDFYLRRKWSLRMALEKIPFFLISLFYGWLAVKIQSEGAINEWQTFTLYQRFIHASYGFQSYLQDFFLPFNLSAFYPYPFITDKGQLPLEFNLSPFIFLAILGMAVAALFMKHRMARVFGTGMLFYFVTVLLVLQFLSVGRAITADRYTYIPYIGILFIFGSWMCYLLEQKKMILRLAGFGLAALFAVLSVVFAFQTHRRAAVWHDDITLWTDVLDRYPDVRMNFIRQKRAEQQLENKEFMKALGDYQVMASLEPKNDEALSAIGQIYGQHLNRLDSAYFWLSRAYEINPENLAVLKNLGVARAMKSDIRGSQELFLRAWAKDPADTALMLNIAANYRFLGDMPKAAEFESKARKNR